MNKRKIYALILAMAILTQVAAPSINVLAEEVNTKKIDEKVSLEENNLKINESLQKKDEIINIPDINLKKALNETLNQAENADITKEQLESITKLDASNKSINSIEGLQYCINLEFLEVMNGQISDINPLKELINLDVLSLPGNKINDIKVLKDLKNLKYLDFGGNQISKIECLEGLTKLEQLYLGGNHITKIEGLAGLSNLNRLILSDNPISKIEGLEELTNLKYLYLRDTEISNIDSLGNLSNLCLLELSENKISKIEGLQGLINLETLFLSNNRIEKIYGLEGLTKLCNFDISDQEIYLSELEANASVEIDNILVGLNGEKIQPSEISSGGNYNLETNKIKWNNISKDVVESYSFTNDIKIGNAMGTYSGLVSQPIKYINNSQGNTDNNSDTNSNGKSDTKNNTSYTSLPKTGVESPLPYIAGVSLLLGSVLSIKKKQ